MIWEVEIRPRDDVDHERLRVAKEYDLLNHSTTGSALVLRSSRGYLIESELAAESERARLLELLADPIGDFVHLRRLEDANRGRSGRSLTVLLKPGVMDPVAQSVLAAGRDI